MEETAGKPTTGEGERSSGRELTTSQMTAQPVGQKSHDKGEEPEARKRKAEPAQDDKETLSKIHAAQTAEPREQQSHKKTTDPGLYTSVGIFDRAYIPNPNIPNEGATMTKTFTIVTYNILAECHRVKDDIYSYTPSEFLHQEYRHGLLMKELQYLDADVVCLQEVNPSYFNHTLLPDMQKLGYEGLMKKKTKDCKDEGAATFYKTDIFELEIREDVSLAEAAHMAIEASGADPEVTAAAKNYTDCPDVVLITRLFCKAASRTVTIGNVHIIYGDFKFHDLQCLEAACAVREVLRVAGSKEAAHILCGDFNGQPWSPVIQLVEKQQLIAGPLQAVEGLKLDDRFGPRTLIGQLEGLFVNPDDSLTSAYKAVTGQEPDVTCCTDETWTLDYIFFSWPSLQAVGVQKVVDKAVIDATGGLPAKDFPSDHLSVKATIAFTRLTGQCIV